MIRSMTGFGRAQIQSERGIFVAELRTLNHRFCDIALHIPRDLLPLEDRVKGVLRGRIARGRVSYHLSWEDGGEAAVRFEVQRPIVAAYLDCFARLREEFGIPGEATLDLLARFPDILSREAEPLDAEKLWEPVRQVTEQALADLMRVREEEGESLRKALLAQLDGILSMAREVARLAPERLERARARLQEKVAQIAPGIPLDDGRLAQELTLMADRWDFTEELVRLESHVHLFRASLDERGAVGRRLGFLLQEMHREVNTLAAKSNDAEIAQRAVGLKEEVEKLREQVENVE